MKVVFIEGNNEETDRDALEKMLLRSGMIMSLGAT